MGLVEIYGTVAAVETLSGPFSAKECVYYRYEVEELRSTGKSKKWVTIRRGEEGTPFLIRDETGSVLVNPQKAQIEIPSDVVYTSSFGKDPPAKIQAFLKGENLSFEGFFGANKTMRFTEYHIAPGDKLYIMGTAQPSGESGAKNTDGIIVCAGKQKNLFYVCDKPEREVLKSLKWQANGGLYGGAALIIVCTAGLLYIFGLW